MALAMTLSRDLPGARAGSRAGPLRGDLAEAGEVFRLHLGGGAVLALDRVVHFLAVDADLLGGGDPQTHLVAADVYHGDLDVVADHDRLIALSRQHQHILAPSWEEGGVERAGSAAPALPAAAPNDGATRDERLGGAMRRAPPEGLGGKRRKT